LARSATDIGRGFFALGAPDDSAFPLNGTASAASIFPPDGVKRSGANAFFRELRCNVDIGAKIFVEK
jgi:hypothetical protein